MLALKTLVKRGRGIDRAVLPDERNHPRNRRIGLTGQASRLSERRVGRVGTIGAGVGVERLRVDAVSHDGQVAAIAGELQGSFRRGAIFAGNGEIAARCALGEHEGADEARAVRAVFIEREGRRLVIGIGAGVGAVSLDGDHDVALGERGNALGCRRRHRWRKSRDGCDTDEKPRF